MAARQLSAAGGAKKRAGGAGKDAQCKRLKQLSLFGVLAGKKRAAAELTSGTAVEPSGGPSAATKSTATPAATHRALDGSPAPDGGKQTNFVAAREAVTRQGECDVGAGNGIEKMFPAYWTIAGACRGASAERWGDRKRRNRRLRQLGDAQPHAEEVGGSSGGGESSSSADGQCDSQGGEMEETCRRREAVRVSGAAQRRDADVGDGATDCGGATQEGEEGQRQGMLQRRGVCSHAHEPAMPHASRAAAVPSSVAPTAVALSVGEQGCGNAVKESSGGGARGGSARGEIGDAHREDRQCAGGGEGIGSGGGGRNAEAREAEGGARDGRWSDAAGGERSAGCGGDAGGGARAAVQGGDAARAHGAVGSDPAPCAVRGDMTARAHEEATTREVVHEATDERAGRAQASVDERRAKEEHAEEDEEEEEEGDDVEEEVEGGEESSEAGAAEGSLTEYEKRRLANIRRNQQLILSLGIEPLVPRCPPPPAPTSCSGSGGGRNKKRPGRAGGGVDEVGYAGVRRSSRLRGKPQGEGGEGRGGDGGKQAEGGEGVGEGVHGESHVEECSEEDDVAYGDSSVVKYLCRVLGGAGAQEGEGQERRAGEGDGSGGEGGTCVQGSTRVAGEDGENGVSGEVGGVKGALPSPPHGCSAAEATPASQSVALGLVQGAHMQDGRLSRIYSVHVLPMGVGAQGSGGGSSGGSGCYLLAAGGHQGRIAVFGATGARGALTHPAALCTALPSPVLFPAPVLQAGATLLLSSSNDSTITLWDINRHHCTPSASSTRRRRVQASGSPNDTVPRVVCELAGVHGQGIFGMHERGLLVAAASKDKTVSLCRVGPSALSLLRRLTHHDVPVRTVHLRYTLTPPGLHCALCPALHPRPSCKTPCCTALLQLSCTGCIQFSPARPSSPISLLLSPLAPHSLPQRLLFFPFPPARACDNSDGDVLVDGAADGSIAVVDTRAAAPVAVALHHCHSSQVNTVHWHPCTPLASPATCTTDVDTTTSASPSSGSNVVLSSSFDHALLVHDIRSPATPLFTLSGHHTRSASLSARPSSQILRPAFVDGGRFVVVPVPLGSARGSSSGECRVALYSMESGKLVSCGRTHVDATIAFALDGLGAPSGRGDVLRDVWLAGKSVAHPARPRLVATALSLVVALSLLPLRACLADATPAEADGRRSCAIAPECTSPAAHGGGITPPEDIDAPTQPRPAISSPPSPPPPITSASHGTAFPPSARASASPCPAHPLLGPSASLYDVLALPRTASWADVQSAHDTCLESWWCASATETEQVSRQRAVQVGGRHARRVVPAARGAAQLWADPCLHAAHCAPACVPFSPPPAPPTVLRSALTLFPPCLAPPRALVLLHFPPHYHPRMQVEQAHRVLSSARLRRLYDLLGEDDMVHAAYDAAVTSGGGGGGRAGETQADAGMGVEMGTDWECCEWLAAHSNHSGSSNERSRRSGSDRMAEQEQSMASHCASHLHHHSLPAVCCSSSAAHRLPHSLPLATACAARIFASLLPPSPHTLHLPPSPPPLPDTHAWLQQSTPITAGNIAEAVFGSPHPWLLLLLSLSSPRSLALLPAWSALGAQLKGIARLGHVDAGHDTHVALRLAPRTCLPAHTRFPAGLPVVLARPTGCRHVDCLLRLPTRSPRASWLRRLTRKGHEDEEEDGEEGDERGAEWGAKLLSGHAWGMKGKADGGDEGARGDRAGAWPADPMTRLREFLVAAGEVLGDGGAPAHSESGAERSPDAPSAASPPAPSPSNPSPPSHTIDPSHPSHMHTSNSLFSLLHLSPSSPYHHLRAPPPPLPSLRQLRRFAFLSLLRVPPIPVVPLQHLPMRFFRTAPDRTVRFVLLLPRAHRHASLEARYWAGRSAGRVAWVAVPWEESDAAAWQRWWRVQQPPALGIYRDPGVVPLVLPGPLNSTVLRHALLHHSSFLLPRLSASSAARLACDPSAPAPPPPYFLSPLLAPPPHRRTEKRGGGIGEAGRGGSTWRDYDAGQGEMGGEGGEEGRRRWVRAREREVRMRTRYCVVVVGTPSPALHKARAAFLEIQHAIAAAAAAAAADVCDECGEDGAAACDVDGGGDAASDSRGAVHVADAGSVSGAAFGSSSAANCAADATDAMTCASTTAVGGGADTGGSKQHHQHQQQHQQQEQQQQGQEGHGMQESVPAAVVAAAREGRVAMAWVDGTVQVRWCAYMLGWQGALWCQRSGRATDDEESDGEGGSEQQGGSRPSLLVSVYGGQVDGSNATGVMHWMNHCVHTGDSSIPSPSAHHWTASPSSSSAEGNSHDAYGGSTNHAGSSAPGSSSASSSSSGQESRSASGDVGKSLSLIWGPTHKAPALVDEDTASTFQSLHHRLRSSLSSLLSSCSTALHRCLCRYLVRPLLPLLPDHWLHTAAAAAEWTGEVVAAAAAAAMAGAAGVAEGDGGFLRTLALAVAARCVLKMVLARRGEGGDGGG
ncbi:unnamed protein product [Closterium sp. Naga37s-1]|nr:unnamed protein product [Closterium sp. Naga37s-1]